MYVVQTYGSRVERVSWSGKVVQSWGRLVDESGAGAGPGQFSGPSGIAVDQQHRVIYVADSNDSRIQSLS
jgi:DNA-binding beta-propeller fold protein YncE